MGFLAKEFPHMVEDYDRLYAGTYAKAGYVRSVRAMIDALQRRHDVGRRPSTSPGRPESVEARPSRLQTDENADAPPEQSAFKWPDDD
jgi:hypothetical protein